MRLLSEHEINTVAGGIPLGPILGAIGRAVFGRNATAATITATTLTGSSSSSSTFNADDEYLDDTNTHAINQSA